MPAYNVNWGEFEKHKALRGSFKDYKHKKPAPLTRSVIKKHLAGHETVGIYPLLKDNTSWFIAADFDGDHWMKESTDLLNSCEEHDLPAYLERSVSGNGGHVWIFFQEPCPAWKSRQVVFHLLREADILSDFDMDASFDRLFPNQDMHSGNGFGNLIALPLNKKWTSQGNTCFIEPVTGEPIVDQWKFLEKIERTTTSRLDQFYSSIKSTVNHTSNRNNQTQNKLKIIINDQIRLSKNNLGPDFVSFLRDKLNFINSDYLVKKNLGRSTFQTEKHFKLIGEEDDKINIPRGFLPDLISYCKEKGHSYNIVDNRQKSEPVVFNSDQHTKYRPASSI